MAAPSISAFPAQAPHPALTDSHGRVIHDLRVSITDRCNYKCVYCRTGEMGAQYPELALDEYLRLIGVFVSLGITKVRLTGGEPLLRRDVVDLVHELSRLRTLGAKSLTSRSPPTAICSTRSRNRSKTWPEPHYGQHGRGRCRDLRAHHAHRG